ncbi:MAG: tRNA guanosine(34) transglycosylase Tgt [Saprospiraceae bacterium]|nr:tRNA guanosine(34) transglycosylase Tgt [Saprospiraceae bacterium]
MFRLEITAPQSKARAGVLSTDHGDIHTPIFMPVGTLGTVKTIRQQDLEDQINAEIILGNTYHLYLKPGLEVLERSGGLHAFMDWKRPILTDSGGYQVYSLTDIRKIKEEGVRFQSHIDGKHLLFTPENVMEIQKTIGADIVMAFDECTPYPCEKSYAERAMHRTHRWLDRCIEAFEPSGPYGHSQHFAGIVQGSVYSDLRRQSSEYIAKKELEINAIGGLSVGEPHPDLYAMTEVCTEILPASKPRYLMGVGTPANILECIDRGIDMFDCVLPTRNARHGLIYTWEGTINIKNAKWKNSLEPVDSTSNSPMSRRHTKAYLRHLFHSGEYLGPQMASFHNLSFYLELVRTARRHILEGNFSDWKKEVVPKLEKRL